jgi:hypothetical protein
VGHSATLPAGRGAVVAPKQLRTCSGSISEGEEIRSEVHARHEGQKYAALGGHEVGAAAIQAIEANFLSGTVAMAHSVAELRLGSEVEVSVAMSY